MERELALANAFGRLETGRSPERNRGRIPELSREARPRTTVRNAGIDSGHEPMAPVMLLAPVLGACLWAVFIHLAAAAL